VAVSTTDSNLKFDIRNLAFIFRFASIDTNFYVSILDQYKSSQMSYSYGE